MFQSLEYTRFFGYNKKTKLYKDEYELTDSDFRCVVVGPLPVALGVTFGLWVVIQEYCKRKLNVAYNLILYFEFYEKK
jgi:hypothetical protein